VATDLFIAASGWPASTLIEAVPPACRRAVEPAPAPRMGDADAVVDFPEWRPRRPARHLVPAFSALGPVPYSFRFELSARAGGTWSPWVGGAAIGEPRFEPVAERADALTAEIDEFRASAPVEAIRLRLRVNAADPRALARDVLSREVGFVRKPHGGRLRVALCFPNSYFVGMSNLGLQTVYRLFNADERVVCERVFLPPRQDLATRELDLAPSVRGHADPPDHVPDAPVMA